MIEINNTTGSRVDKNFLRRVARNVLKKEKKNNTELSIALVDEKKIKELNKKYRNKNKPTDVLSFTENTRYKIQNKKYKARILGEVAICLKEVKKNAKRFGFTFEKELARVLIHGILHLLGYRHGKNKAKARIMERKQEYYFSKIFPSTSKKESF